MLGLSALVAKVFPEVVKADPFPYPLVTCDFQGRRWYAQGTRVWSEPTASEIKYRWNDPAFAGKWKWIEGDACQDLTAD